ncbi:MAG: MarR family winged helix-turn-helix transcriptional regulator [Microthrixaceae bacterium]
MTDHATVGDRVPSIEARLHGALLGVMNVMREHLERVAAEHALSPQQAVSLFRLGTEEALSMRELAGELHCDPSNVTGIADRLEERGLVSRHHREGDRRVKLLALTDDGRRLRADLADEVNRGVPGLSALAPSDQQELLRILLTVLDAAGAAPMHSGD